MGSDNMRDVEADLDTLVENIKELDSKHGLHSFVFAVRDETGAVLVLGSPTNDAVLDTMVAATTMLEAHAAKNTEVMH